MTFIDWELVEHKAGGPTAASEDSPSLQILAATFGGVIVTERIQELCSDDGAMDVDMSQMVHYLAPDPFPNNVKTLAVLYRFQEDEDIFLLNATEQHAGLIHVSRAGEPSMAIQRIEKIYRRKAYPDVEILAVLYGIKRVQTPSVLLDLARFFSAAGNDDDDDGHEQTQIRMNNQFFKGDPWLGQFKTWTVFFKFAGSKRVQCVSGLEHQALEVPWCRHK
jgi:hypothetical protein